MKCGLGLTLTVKLNLNPQCWSQNFMIKWNISVLNNVGANPDTNNVDIKVILKNCDRFTDWIIQINNVQLDIALDIAVVMPMCSI